MPETALVPSGARTMALDAPASPAGFVQFANLNEAMKFAEFIASSELVPKPYQKKPADIVIAMQMGMELGFSPLQALQTIGVINGKPGIYGDGIPALIIGDPDCVDFHEQEPSGSDEKKWVATCTIQRRGKTPVVRTFSYDDAKKAGLWGKSGPWSSYPKRMLQMRARGFASRDAFPDKLKGIKTIEELRDYPDEPTSATISEPRRIGEGSAIPVAPPAEEAPADGAAASPAVPTATTPAAAPSQPPASAGSPDQVSSGIAIAKSEMSRDPDGRALFHFTTPDGMFYARDESIYTALATLEGTDHTATLTWRIGRKNGTTVRVITAATVDEPQAAEEGGDQ